MLTGAQMAVVGYVTDGDVVCVRCFNQGDHWQEVSPLIEYSASEWAGESGNGLQCGECGEDIVKADNLCEDCAPEEYYEGNRIAGERCDWCGHIVDEDDEEDEELPDGLFDHTGPIASE